MVKLLDPAHCYEAGVGKCPAGYYRLGRISYT